jgi:hypothetical protein
MYQAVKPCPGKEARHARQQLDLSEPAPVSSLLPKGDPSCAATTGPERTEPRSALALRLPGTEPSTARARQTEPLWRAYVRVGLWCNADRRYEGAHAGLAPTAISPSTTSAVAGS